MNLTKKVIILFLLVFCCTKHRFKKELVKVSENIFDPIVESIFQCGKVIYKCLSGNKFDFREFFEAAGLKKQRRSTS